VIHWLSNTDTGRDQASRVEDENRRLKQMDSDLSLENRALKDVIAKKL
jgi:hypothetical protein